jgi:hypothetical protein
MKVNQNLTRTVMGSEATSEHAKKLLEDHKAKFAKGRAVYKPSALKSISEQIGHLENEYKTMKEHEQSHWKQ